MDHGRLTTTLLVLLVAGSGCTAPFSGPSTTTTDGAGNVTTYGNLSSTEQRLFVRGLNQQRAYVRPRNADLELAEDGDNYVRYRGTVYRVRTHTTMARQYRVRNVTTIRDIPGLNRSESSEYRRVRYSELSEHGKQIFEQARRTGETDYYWQWNFPDPLSDHNFVVVVHDGTYYYLDVKQVDGPVQTITVEKADTQP